MNWYSEFLSNEQIKSISDEVTEAEKNVHAEIVPILVKSSTTTGSIPLIITTTFLFIITSIHHPKMDSLYLFPLNLLWLLIIPSLFFLSSWATRKSLWIQRILTNESDKEIQVRRRAILEFYLNRVFRTGNQNGILIFVSLMERKAVVYTDEGLIQILSEDSCREILKPLLSSLKSGDIYGAFIAAIQKSSVLLRPHCPELRNQTNELNNQLIIKE